MQRDITTMIASLALREGITLRAWTEADYPAVQRLAHAEGWTTQDTYPDDLRLAWQHSWPALVAVVEETGELVGFLRGITDSMISVYVADLVIAPAYRSMGLGSALVEACHRLVPTARLDLLATTDAALFYERIGFRPFRGYRKRFR